MQASDEPIFPISCAIYACLAAYITSITRFSVLRLTLYKISNTLLESFNICTGIGYLKMDSNFSQIASVQSNKSAKAITLADNTERETSHGSNDLSKTGMEL